MSDSPPRTTSGPMGLPDSYGLTGNKITTVGKMMMGPAVKKNKNKAPKLSGAKRFPVRFRKGM